MATVTLNFTNNINVSLQVGDILYYVDSSSDKNQIGTCTAISGNDVTCDTDTNDITSLTVNSYIYFIKDSVINLSGLKGYYAEIEFTNDSTGYAELFSVASEINLSSN